MWRQYLESLIGVEAAASYEITFVPHDGVSGAKVLFLRDTTTGMRYVLKYGEPSLNPQHTIASQYRNREMIAPHFGEYHLPRVFAHNGQAMLMGLFEGSSLYDIVVRNTHVPSYLSEMARRVCFKFGKVWSATSRSTNEKDVLSLARDPTRRFDRVKTAVLGRAFGSIPVEDYCDQPLIVNGEELPPLSRLLDAMPGMYSPPQILVTCHGDPNGENVLINDVHQWALIDWEWAGTHDWRVVTSFLTGWWTSNASSVRRSQISVEDGRLIINYELVLNELATFVVDEGWRLAERIGNEFDDSDWRSQVELQIAVLLLGDVRFVRERRRPNHDIPLLGEGLRILGSLMAKKGG